MSANTAPTTLDRAELESVILAMLVNTGRWSRWVDRTHKPFAEIETQMDATETTLQNVFTALVRGPLRSTGPLHLNLSWSDTGPEGAQVEVELPGGGYVTAGWHSMNDLLPDPQTPGLRYLVQIAETLIAHANASLELAEPLLAPEPYLDEQTSQLVETVRSADHVDISWIARSTSGRRVAQANHSIDPTRAERLIHQIGDPA